MCGRRRPSPLPLLGLAALAACAGGTAAGPPQTIVLLVVDTLRADHLSCYGFRRHETPHIDALAARGVRFTQAHAMASWTVPSVAALLSSRLPRRLGLIETRADRRFGPFELREQQHLTLPEGAPHLAEALRREGFRTAGFVDQPLLDAASGFERGFDDWFHVVGRGRVARHDPRRTEPAASWDDTPFAFENDAALVERFGLWLSAREAESRSFAWLHLLTPHAPYLPPEAFAADTPEAADPLSPVAYAGEVRAADALVGRVLELISAHVGLDRALVVFTADHGESLGEHGELGHGQSLHGEVLRIPLLLSGPGLPRGTTVEALVRAIDVAPTILELAGAAPPAHASGDEGLEGESLLPLLRGEETGERTLYAEGMLYGPSERSLAAGGFKLLLDAQSGRAQLYSLVDDPREREDLAERAPSRARALRERLDETLRALVAESAAPGGGDDVPSERERAALRALGYLRGREPEAADPRAAGEVP